MSYNKEQIQRDIEFQNDDYKRIIEMEIKVFLGKLIDEIEEIFRYYRMPIRRSSIEMLIDEIEPDLKNEIGYKKIMNILSDGTYYAMNNTSNALETIDTMVNSQTEIVKNIDFSDLINIITRYMNRQTQNDNVLGELRSTLRKKFNNLYESANSINNEFIQKNKSYLENNLLASKEENKSNHPMLNQVINSLKPTLKNQSADKTMESLEKTFELLEENGFSKDDITIVIDELLKELPFGPTILVEYLNNKKEELTQSITQNSSFAAAFK